MSRPRLLFDEHVPAAIVVALRNREPSIDILTVGGPGAPPKGTSDAELVVAAEALGRLLLTFDRRSMPAHLVAHFRGGHRTAGVIMPWNGFTLAEYVDEILLVWDATTGDEWVDTTVYLP